jgi:hypothetical protein
MPACPHCGIWLVKKASRRGLREYLLSLLTLGPFRCQICTHRFLDFTWWPGPDPRREYNRIPVRYPVLLSPTREHKDKGPHYEEGTLLDLSIRGCAIKSDVPLHKGDSLCLQLRLTDKEPPVEIDIAMVRTVTGRRFGLEFAKIRPDEETRLGRLLMTLMQGR